MAVFITTDGTIAAGGAIVETSGGVKYAVFRDRSIASYLYIAKNLDTTPVSVFNGHMGALDTKAAIHAAIDSTDKIHIIISHQNDFSNSIYYGVWDTSDDSWAVEGEQIQIYGQGFPAFPGVAISIDSNDKPHILFVDTVKMQGSNQDNVYYTEKTGPSWANTTQIGERATKTHSYKEPTLTLKGSDDIEAFYYFALPDSDPAYRTFTGSWSGETLYVESSGATIGRVTVAAGGTVYRYHHDAAANMDENHVDTGYNLAGPGRIAPSFIGTDRYIFYVDTGDDIHLISNNGGGWVDEGDLQVGTFDYVIAEWAFNHENQSNEINYLFEDGTDLSYASHTGTPSLVLGASRIANATRVDQSEADDADVTDWLQADDFIIATRLYHDDASAVERALKLQWRNVTDAGSFADVTDTGEITYSADTDLVDGASVLQGEKLCNQQDSRPWDTGEESEGDNLLPDAGTHSLPAAYYTEHHWALHCSAAPFSKEYEFRLIDVTESLTVGTCGATLTMMPDPDAGKPVHMMHYALQRRS